jgi:glycosyltransferase involved in cell wall biosynthesis
VDNSHKITISIIGHNEAENLTKCLDSLSWADEIVFVDCDSADNSIEIARNYTERIFQRPNLRNLNENKSFGFEQCTSAWIFYLDPDEVIPEKTANWIRQELKNPLYDAYLFPRRNFILNSWLKHGSRYPDLQLRLFKKDKGHFPCKHVHERLHIAGTIGKSKYAFDHHPYPSLDIYVNKFNFYTSFDASVLFNNPPGKLAWTKYLLYKPIFRFFKRYILNRGFLDGYAGLVAAFFDMINFPVRYFKYIELKRNKISHRDTENTQSYSDK